MNHNEQNKAFNEHSSTMTDMRLTRHPADTPRARIHQLAAWGARCGHRLGARRFAGLCEALTTTLVTLEAAENKIRYLEGELLIQARELSLERGHNEKLRASLAAEQVRTSVVLQEIPAERWDEVTRPAAPQESRPAVPTAVGSEVTAPTTRRRRAT